MTELIQPVKGFNDVLADQAPLGHGSSASPTSCSRVTAISAFACRCSSARSFSSRSIGELTDIVSKEMFTFDDHGESLTLRPEATAGVVRAA